MQKIFLINITYSDYLDDIIFDIRDEQIVRETHTFYTVESKEHGKNIIQKGKNIASIKDVLNKNFKIQIEDYYNHSIDCYDHYYIGIFTYDNQLNTVKDIEEAKNIIKKTIVKDYVKLIKEQIEQLSNNLNKALNI